MSSGPEPGVDLVAVACVVEASLLLASEWSRVLIDYVYPLLKRLNELHPSHQFRLAFVTYGAADTRPLPLLSKRYFAPLFQVTRELREEPSKLGIGQTNSGSGRGLSALEGFVAAIELFDILMMSANFNINHTSTQSPQKDSRSLISHLLHIAASPPDNLQRPQWNTLHHLDSVNWDSIPAELRKRKINLSLIGLRKIPQFQDLQSLVAGSGVQSPWFSVHAPHTLLLAGFPTPQRIGASAKRQIDVPLSDQSPDTKRQKIIADPTLKASSASPALSSARIPQNQRSQQTTASHVAQPPSSSLSGQNSSPLQPVPAFISAPAPSSTAPTVPPPSSGPSMSVVNPEILEQVVAPTGLKFGQMMERLKVAEREIAVLDSQILSAQNAGQAAVLAGLQNDRTTKIHFREQIKILLKQHYHRALLAKESLNAQAGTTGSALTSGPAEAGPSTGSHPPNAPIVPTEQLTGPPSDEHKPAVPDTQVVAHFWQSRGGTISTLGSTNPQFGPSQAQAYPAGALDAAVQMQRLKEKKGIQSQNFAASLQTSGTTSHETSVGSSTPNNQVMQSPNTSTWYGTFSGTFPKLSGQATNELQIHVFGIFPALAPNDARTDIRTDVWPKNFTLNPCKEPLKDNTELSSWLKRHQPRTRMMKFTPNPHAPDRVMNEQKFYGLNKFMSDHRIYAYAGWQLPSGKFSYNVFIFPMNGSFAGAVFPGGLPDLPGSGNALDVQPSVEEAKPQLSSGLALPPNLIAYMQGLEPAKQRQLFAHFIRAQQEQLRRQQAQQTQQSHTVPGQALNPVGMSVLPNSYGMVANTPTPHGSVNTPTNAGTFSPGSGTVNYEMIQSFMQRTAEGSPGMGSG